LKLKDWLQPNYQQLLIFMAGMVIGLSVMYELLIKMLLLGLAVVFLLLAGYIHKKDAEGIE